MAVEFRLGDRHPGRREHDHQRCYARDAVVGGAQGDDCSGIVSIVRHSSARHSRERPRGAPASPVYQLVLVPPSPLASWNHRVRRKFWLWSLNLNDLRVRSLITNDLASISPRLVFKERRLVGLGQLRGLSWLTGTPLSCHRSISIVADGRVLCL